MNQRFWGHLSLMSLVVLLLLACNSDAPKTNAQKQSSNPLKKMEEVNDWKLSALRGKVKMLVEKTYRSEAKAMADLPFSITRSRFYENGNLQEMLTEMDDGSKRSYKYRYTTDSIFVDNWLLQNDTVVERQQFIYLRDENGARTKMMLPAPKGQQPNYFADIKNNAAGLPLEYHHHLKKEEDRLRMPCKEIRKYDENNYLISEEMYRYNAKDGSCTPTNTIRHYKNDEQGNCIEEQIIKNDSILLNQHKYIYSYDAKGNWVEKKRYSPISGQEEVTLVVLRKFEFY
jgi:hypothetical protein